MDTFKVSFKHLLFKIKYRYLSGSTKCCKVFCGLFEKKTNTSVKLLQLAYLHQWCYKFIAAPIIWQVKVLKRDRLTWGCFCTGGKKTQEGQMWFTDSATYKANQANKDFNREELALMHMVSINWRGLSGWMKRRDFVCHNG